MMTILCALVVGALIRQISTVIGCAVRAYKEVKAEQ